MVDARLRLVQWRLDGRPNSSSRALGAEYVGSDGLNSIPVTSRANAGQNSACANTSCTVYVERTFRNAGSAAMNALYHRALRTVAFLLLRWSVRAGFFLKGKRNVPQVFGRFDCVYRSHTISPSTTATKRRGD